MKTNVLTNPCVSCVKFGFLFTHIVFLCIISYIQIVIDGHVFGFVHYNRATLILVTVTS